MTADVVNLRRARKTRDRTTQSRIAAANRVTHGRSRAEQDATATELQRTRRLLDGHRLTGDDETP